MNRILYLLLPFALLTLHACTASGDPVEGNAEFPNDGGKASSSDSKSSSSAVEPDVNSDIFGLFDWVKIPKSSITRGVNSFGVNAFSMATTEVTQKVYKFVMDELPKQSKEGDKRAVSNVNWFHAALFCNAFSKLAGLDTAYVYKSVIGDSVLVDLTIDYSVIAVRLPTENEWEIAARGGTTTTYYWDVDVASKYAYYGQTSGPDEVAKKLPNEFGLYDMAGNVAEWVNDWYDAYPKKQSDNYTGPESGDYRIVRGGGWSDKVTVLAPKEREKHDPALSKATLGFRLVYSTGF
ncbi:MAG: SUMF1/EgtB/PvdO family nonheme iron enzyme [Fibrobacter sp.]|nr:SUMF1/EgtB/PvdO family nonheme iron enzyme [Fibrobacter sp.]